MKCVMVLNGHTDWVRALCLVWRGRQQIIASGSDDKTILLWDTESGECVGVLEGHTHWILTLAPLSSREGNSILASGSDSIDSSIRIWNVESMACLAVLNGHKNTIYSVSFAEGLPDNSVHLVSSSLNEKVSVWDMTPFVKQVRSCLSYIVCFFV